MQHILRRGFCTLVRWPVRAVFTSNFQFQNCTLHTSKSHIAHFQIPTCALHTSKSHIVHFQIQSCTLPISKLHASNFQIAHFEFQNCTLPISELRTSKISLVAFSALLKNGLVTLFSASPVNVGLRILSVFLLIPLELYRARTNLIRWRSTGRFDVQSCISRL